MRPARIAELLEPFLHLPATADPYHSELKTFSHHELKPSGHSELKTSRYQELKTSCHSESGRRPGEEPAVPAATTDHRLTTNDLDHISTYIDILIRWNARMNLTAIRDPEAIVTRHFGESLFAARHYSPEDSCGDGCRGAPRKSGPRGPASRPDRSRGFSARGRRQRPTTLRSLP